MDACEGCFCDVTRPRDAAATSYPTNATRRNHFSNLLFSFFHTDHKQSDFFFYIVFPPEVNFDIDAGDGGGGKAI